MTLWPYAGGCGLVLEVDFTAQKELEKAMFRRTQAVAVAAISRSEAHGHATMNDAQTLMKGIGEIVKAAAEDLAEVVEEAKTTLKEARDGVTIETKIEVEWADLMHIVAAIKQGTIPSVSSLPLTLVNRIVLEEKPQA